MYKYFTHTIEPGKKRLAKLLGVIPVTHEPSEHRARFKWALHGTTSTYGVQFELKEEQTSEFYSGDDEYRDIDR